MLRGLVFAVKSRIANEQWSFKKVISSSVGVYGLLRGENIRNNDMLVGRGRRGQPWFGLSLFDLCSVSLRRKTESVMMLGVITELYSVTTKNKLWESLKGLEMALMKLVEN